MRIQNWPALVGGCVIAALIGQSVLAADRGGQRPGPATRAAASDDSDASDESSGPASWINPVQYGNENGYPGGGPGSLPPSDGGYSPGIAPSNAWPTTSPYENRIEQTSNVDGLWQNYTDNNYDQKWIFGLEYLYSHGLRPGNQSISYPAFQGAAVFPGSPNNPSTFGANLWPTQFTSVFANPFHDGLRVLGGYDNQDDSGVRLSGFILFDEPLTNSVPFGVPFGQTPIQSLAAFRTNDNGVSRSFFFDSGFSQTYKQQILGADLDGYQIPFFTWNAFKVKTILGAKYLQIHEDFFVQGDASGLGYTVDTTTGAITGPFSRLVPAYSTTLSSRVTSNLVGPTIGLRYDLGGDKFKIWGQSKFGVMANIERDVVGSTNFAQIMQFNNTNTNLTGNPGHPLFSTSVGRNTVRLAPLFQTSVNIEFPFFKMVPYLNKFAILRESNFRVGYDLVFVGEIARPAQNIEYNYANPSPNNNRQTFDYSTFNFGLDWHW